MENTSTQTKERITKLIFAAKSIEELNQIVARHMNLSLPEAMFEQLAVIAERKQWELYEHN